MKKIFILTFLCALLTSLTIVDKDIIGKYLTKGARMRYYVKLKSNHSFVQEMKSCICDYRAKGTWSTNADTLNLHVKTNKDLRDKSPEKQVDHIEKFLITEKGLLIIWKSPNKDSIQTGSTIRRVK